jgi:hypothetical protein
MKGDRTIRKGLCGDQPALTLQEIGKIPPFVKGGKEGFNLRCLYNYGLINKIGAVLFSEIGG